MLRIAVSYILGLHFTANVDLSRGKHFLRPLQWYEKLTTDDSDL